MSEGTVNNVDAIKQEADRLYRMALIQEPDRVQFHKHADALKGIIDGLVNQVRTLERFNRIEQNMPDGWYELVSTVQGIGERLDLLRWQLEKHSHHIHSEQVGTLEARIPDLGDYYSTDKGPTPKE